MRLQKPVVEMIHDTLSAVVSEGDIAVDATAGNGYDTLKLAQLVGESGHVYAFDIQQEALDRTRELLEDAKLLHRTTLFCMDHSVMNTVVKDQVAAVVFNLGYLPGGNHNLITKPEKTIAALEHSVELLRTGGVVMIGVYWGHPGGEIEKNAVEHWVSRLPAANYDIMEISFPNRRKAPIVITLQKKS